MLGRSGGRVAGDVGGGSSRGDSPRGVEMRDLEDRRGSTSKADGFSLVAAVDDDDGEQLIGGGGGGGPRGSGRGAAGGSDSRQHLSSDGRTFVNLLISFVGVGLLGIPNAYKEGGLLLSTGVFALVGVVCTYCMWMLVRCKYRVIALRGKGDNPGPVKYADICHEALGKWGLVAVESALVASFSGFSTAYLVFIGSISISISTTTSSNSNSISSRWRRRRRWSRQHKPPSESSGRRRARPVRNRWRRSAGQPSGLLRNLHALFAFRDTPVIFLCVPGLVLMCLIKHLKYLAPFSLVAEVVNLTGLAVVFFDDAEFIWLNHESISMAQWKAVPFVLGVGVYCFGGIGMVIPIEEAMTNRENFTPILSWVMVIYTSLCVLSGGLGYMAFGDATKDIILLNIGLSVSTLIVKISFCVGLYFTFPIMMVPVWEVLEFKWLRHHSPSYGRDRNLLRAAVVLATGVVACAVPNFGLFLSLIGNSSCALLVLIMPTLCYTRLEKTAGFPLGPRRSLMNNIILAAGIFAMIYGTADTLRSIGLEYSGGDDGAGHARP